MKRHSTIISLILILLFESCYKSEKYENVSLFSFKDFKEIIKLNATTIEFDVPIMLPLLFVKSDSLLIVQNIKTNNMLYVYNIFSKKKVGEFISWGSGPNELLRIKNMQLIGSDLYISDSQKRAIYKYDVNDFYKLADELIPIQKVIIDDHFYNLAYTDNGYVALSINSDNKRLVFYNSKGEKVFTAGEYPHFGRKLTVIEQMEGFQSSIVISRNYKRIYLFGMDTDLIEIYDFKGNLIKRIQGPDRLFPQVKEVRLKNGMTAVSALRKTIFAYFSPIIIDDEIYVSYSGNYQKIDEEVPVIHHIFVFDMDGNPIRRYELPKSIVSFTIDAIAKNIYATCNDPEYHLILLSP